MTRTAGLTARRSGPGLILRALLAGGALCVASAASALTFVTGSEYRIDFGGQVGGVQTGAVSGLTSSLVLRLVSVANGWFTFDYSLTNSSALNSRITSFGFASIPDVTDGRVLSGAFNNMLVEGETWLPVSFPGYKPIEMCMTTGLTCSGGMWGGAAEGTTLSGRFQLQATGTSLELGNFAVRYQSINGSSGGQTFLGASGIGIGTVSAVPEPSVWAMLIVGFGLVGQAIRQRRRTGRGALIPA